MFLHFFDKCNFIFLFFKEVHPLKSGRMEVRKQIPSVPYSSYFLYFFKFTYLCNMQISAQQLAEFLNGTVEGDPQATVNRPGKIEEGGDGALTFLANPKYEAYAYTTTASIMLVDHKFRPAKPVHPTLVRVDDVYASMALLMERFAGAAPPQVSGIAPEAYIHPESQLGEGVSVGAQSVIEQGAVIGDHCRIFPQVYIGRNARLGNGVTLHPGVRIYHDCEIGDGCILHSNVVVGGDGFGFAPQKDGSFKKIPQLGNVVIEKNVEIGSGTTIDRATMGSTVIREGVKIDNLVMVAHNVEIGKHTVIAAQAGIAGSTTIGAHCMIGGQVGIVGHIEIADGTRIQAQSGVNRSIREQQTAIYGSPALPYQDFLRSYVLFRKLPELQERIAELEKAFNKT